MAFQRVILNGVPFWRSASVLYAYELPVPTPETALKLGEETLYPNWRELYASRLASYRENVKSQARKVK
jgi:hypothetical protein